MPRAQGHHFPNENNIHSHFQTSQFSFISFVFISLIDPLTFLRSPETIIF